MDWQRIAADQSANVSKPVFVSRTCTKGSGHEHLQRVVVIVHRLDDLIQDHPSSSQPQSDTILIVVIQIRASNDRQLRFPFNDA